MFSSLAARIPGASVLDLYCGSGAYGLEALSRGADRAVFVDLGQRSIRAARANAKASGYADVTVFRREDALRFLRRPEEPFDLVFADPPYDDAGVVERLVVAVPRRLGPGGTAVIEVRRGGEVPQPPPGCILEADRRYGDTRVLVLRREES